MVSQYNNLLNCRSGVKPARNCPGGSPETKFSSFPHTGTSISVGKFLCRSGQRLLFLWLSLFLLLTSDVFTQLKRFIHISLWGFHLHNFPPFVFWGRGAWLPACNKISPCVSSSFETPENRFGLQLKKRKKTRWLSSEYPSILVKEMRFLSLSLSLFLIETIYFPFSNNPFSLCTECIKILWNEHKCKLVWNCAFYCSLTWQTSPRPH